MHLTLPFPNYTDGKIVTEVKILIRTGSFQFDVLGFLFLFQRQVKIIWKTHWKNLYGFSLFMKSVDPFRFFNQLWVKEQIRLKRLCPQKYLINSTSILLCTTLQLPRMHLTSYSCLQSNKRVFYFVLLFCLFLVNQLTLHW